GVVRAWRLSGPAGGAHRSPGAARHVARAPLRLAAGDAGTARDRGRRGPRRRRTPAVAALHPPQPCPHGRAGTPPVPHPPPRGGGKPPAALTPAAAARPPLR